MRIYIRSGLGHESGDPRGLFVEKTEDRNSHETVLLTAIANNGQLNKYLAYPKYIFLLDSGYGNIAPVTFPGRLFCIFFAIGKPM
jgi:hypothetical protein